MPNEQDGKLKFGRSYVYLDPDSLESTPDAATPGVWRVKSGVDNSGDPTVGLVNAVNTRTGNVTLTSSDVGLANVNNTSDANKPVSSAQQTALNAKIDTTTANSTLLGITAKAADSELLDGLNSTSFVQTNTQFGGDVSGTYNAIVIADDSHNHVISNVDGLQSTLNVKADLVGGLVPTNQLPAIAITEYLGSVSSQSALLALSGQKGDWAIRSDTSTTWIITGTTPSDITSWTELQYPAAPVSSVNGATGTVVLGHSDVGAASTSQGSTADSAIQPGDNISQLTNNSGFISATLTDEEVQDIVGGMVSGNTENGITVTYQDTDGTIDFDVATQSDNNFTTVLKNKLDAIEVSATADQTASEIITSLLTVDGANSGLDSDLLDGQHGSYYLDYTNFTNIPTFENANKLDNLDSTQFLRSDAVDIKTSGNLKFNDNIKLTFGSNDDLEISHNQTHNIIKSLNGNISLQAPAGSEIQLSQGGTFEQGVRFIAGSYVALYYNGSKKIETTNTGAEVTGTLTATAFSGAGGNVTGVNASQLNSQNAAYYLDYSNFSNTPTIPTNNNQLTNGAGYLTSLDGGDAITLDGLDSTDFLRSNADDTFTGELTVSGNLLLSDQVRIGNDAWIEDFDGANAIRVKGNTDSTQGYIAFGNRTEKLGCNNSATLSYDGNTIWNAGNDGSGSGLDADTVDGLDPNVTAAASSIAVRDSSSDITLRTIKSTFADETTISGAVGYRINNSTDNSLRFCSNMSAVRTHMGTNNASNLTTGTIPIARISGGAGTGLDADLLDGVQGSSYLRSDANDSFSGTLTGSGRIRLTANSTVEVGDGSGSVAMTVNDGYGNANLCFNHWYGVPDQSGSSGRIECTVDSNTAHMYFELANSTTSGVAVQTSEVMRLTTSAVTMFGNTAWHAGNDGSGSGLDADMVDGVQLSGLIRSQTGSVLGSMLTLDNQSSNYRWNNSTNGRPADAQANEFGTLLHLDYDGSRASQFAWDIQADNLYLRTLTYSTDTGTAWKKVWTDGNDGSGSGLDADTLDGVQGSSYLRSDAADSFSGVLTGTAPIAFNGTLATFDPPSSGAGTDTATDVALGLGTGHRIAGHTSGYIRSLFEWNASGDITIGQGGTGLITGINLMPGSSGPAKVNGNTIWHAGNDGSGSGLDADTLDGVQGALYETKAAKEFFSITNSGTTAGTWLGSHSDISTYFDGMTIAFYQNNIAGASTTTININSLGAKTIYYANDSKLTTHYGKRSLIMLQYDAQQDRFYAHDFYYATDDYRMRWQNNLIAGAQIDGYQLLMQGIDGKMYPVTAGGVTTNSKTVSTAELRVGGLMLHYENANNYAANAVITGNHIYTSIFEDTMEYWHNYDSGWATTDLPWYIVCTMNGNGNFVLDNSSFTSFLTQTLPTSDDGKFYIMGGWMHNTHDQYRLQIDHPIYVYKNGAVRMFSGDAGMTTGKGIVLSMIFG